MWALWLVHMDNTRNALHVVLSASNVADETILQEFAAQ